MQLFNHQWNALAWAKGRDSFPCFMEMRTGKSLVAIHQTMEWQASKVLLIAPMSTWFDWENLLGSMGINSITLSGPTKNKRDRLLKYYHLVKWIIVNPEGITRWGKDFFELIGADVCILDESVFIKNPKAKVTKLLLKYGSKFPYKMVMTGTPIAESTEDVVTQMIWCNGSFMDCTNFYAWRIRYMKPARFGWTLKKGVKELIRRTLKEESFVLSAKDAGLYVQQVKQRASVELPDDVRKAYDYMERHWRLEEACTKYGVVKDSWLAAMACGIYPRDEDTPHNIFKTKQLEYLLDGELKHQQVAIFSRWLAEVYHVSKSLKCPCITGNTPYEERKVLIEEFRKGTFEHLVVQAKTASRGLDLSCVDNLIMLSNHWQHELRKQIEARMNHPMRKTPSLFIDVISNNTIEEHVYDLLKEKEMNARFFLQRLKVRCKRR